ncbi:MAG: zinc ABC transporter substrate-binding protein [Endomicrobiaceae bacterium]|nr:zinc ABC transporter substrate-binding protein [Endomicrobiaceae bacterium]
MRCKLFALILSIIFIPTIIFAYSPLPDKKIKIAVTTSNLSTLINEICKDKIDVITIIPTSICPGSYDIDAKTIKEINKCNIILYNTWQPWVKNLKGKLTNLGVVFRELKTEGNSMIPYINLKAAQELLELLSVWDQDNKDFYEKNFLDYSFRVNFISNEIVKNSPNKYNKKIVCNNKIASFLEWLGFNVIATYGKASNMSSSEMLFITKKIKKEKVKYVVDNLQAGTDIGRSLSNDLKIKHIVISNFALGRSYINTLKDNIEKIDKALN